MKSTIRKKLLSIMVSLTVIASSTLSFAGGPIALFGSGTPYVWGGGVFATFPIPYLKDMGSLGPLTKAGADALTDLRMTEWSSVVTSTFSAFPAGDTPMDIVAANAAAYLFTFHGAVLDVIYDTDGTICAFVFGCPPGVLGLGGPSFLGTMVPEIASGFAMMVGTGIDPGDVGGLFYSVVFSQEVGHAMGLHHDQTNGAISFFGDNSAPTGCPSVGLPTFADFTAMYPFASVSPGGPGADAASIDHPEDLNSLSRFYPAPGYDAATGTIVGTVFASDGVTPVNGVNVIARNILSPFGDARSTVSGDLSFVAGDAFVGTFVLTGLTPGESYTLAIDNIVAGAFPKPPAPPFIEKYWNSDPTVVDPCDFTAITAMAGIPFTANFILLP